MQYYKCMLFSSSRSLVAIIQKMLVEQESAKLKFITHLCIVKTD